MILALCFPVLSWLSWQSCDTDTEERTLTTKLSRHHHWATFLGLKTTALKQGAEDGAFMPGSMLRGEHLSVWHVVGAGRCLWGTHVVEWNRVVLCQGEAEHVLLPGLQPDAHGGGQHGGADGVAGVPWRFALFPGPPARVPFAVLLCQRLLLDHQDLVIAQVPQEWILRVSGWRGKEAKRNIRKRKQAENCFGWPETITRSC